MAQYRTSVGDRSLMLHHVRFPMDDRALIRAVLIVVVLSLVVNAYTLYGVRGQAAVQEAPPANFFGVPGRDLPVCPMACSAKCEGKADYTQCYSECMCGCQVRTVCSAQCKNDDGPVDWQCFSECHARRCSPG